MWLARRLHSSCLMSVLLLGVTAIFADGSQCVTCQNIEF